MISDAIYRAFYKKATREKKDQNGKWKYPMFWAIDLHDVIIPSNYNIEEFNPEFYPNAENVLKWLTKQDNMKIILFTCSHQKTTNKVKEWLKQHDIMVDFVNENPMCENNELANFDKKFYFDVLLEDKAGFNAENDWFEIEEALNNIERIDRKIELMPFDKNSKILYIAKEMSKEELLERYTRIMKEINGKNEKNEERNDS